MDNVFFGSRPEDFYGNTDTLLFNEKELRHKIEGLRKPSSIDGDSAYDIAKYHGYRGTKDEWLATLKGKDIEHYEVTSLIGSEYLDVKIDESELKAKTTSSALNNFIPTHNRLYPAFTRFHGGSVVITHNKELTDGTMDFTLECIPLDVRNLLLTEEFDWEITNTRYDYALNKTLTSFKYMLIDTPKDIKTGVCKGFSPVFQNYIDGFKIYTSDNDVFSKPYLSYPKVELGASHLKHMVRKTPAGYEYGNKVRVHFLSMTSMKVGRDGLISNMSGTYSKYKDPRYLEEYPDGTVQVPFYASIVVEFDIKGVVEK